jgi:hypothetical protein
MITLTVITLNNFYRNFKKTYKEVGSRSHWHQASLIDVSEKVK